MRGWPSSPRRRRRIVRVGAAGALLGVIAVVGLLWPNTGDHPTRVGSGPVIRTPNPAQVKPARDDLLAARKVAARFIVTAVARQHLDESYGLSTPAMHQGLSLEEWRGGNIPVPTYPIDQLGQAREKIVFSYKDDIDLEVLVIPRPKSTMRPTVFSAELRATGHGGARRWLVDSWTPVSASAAASPASGSTAIDISRKAPLGVVWLLLPLGILGLIVIVPLGLWLRAWYRNSRAMRDYSSSSRPS